MVISFCTCSCLTQLSLCICIYKIASSTSTVLWHSLYKIKFMDLCRPSKNPHKILTFRRFYTFDHLHPLLGGTQEGGSCSAPWGVLGVIVWWTTPFTTTMWMRFREVYLLQDFLLFQVEVTVPAPVKFLWGKPERVFPKSNEKSIMNTKTLTWWHCLTHSHGPLEERRAETKKLL